MKLSRKQAELIAKKVREKLLGTVDFVPESQKVAIRKFVDDRKEYSAAVQEAQNEVNVFDRNLPRIVGPKINAYNKTDANALIREVEKASIPSVDTIADEITLASMFTKEEDLEKFIDGVVKKLTPRKSKAKV